MTRGTKSDHFSSTTRWLSPHWPQGAPSRTLGALLGSRELEILAEAMAH